MVSTIPFKFFDEICKAEKAEYPSLVRKYKLTPNEMGEVANLLQNGTLKEERFNQLVAECKGCGIINASKVFDKYSISEEEQKTVKAELTQWFFRQ